jgi:hypothetical protein
LLGDRGSSPDKTRNLEERFVMPVVKYELHAKILFTAAELLRQMSTDGAISGHEQLPASESPLASSNEFNQSVQTPYGTHFFLLVGRVSSYTSLEPLMLPDETWIDASAPWARNSNSPIPDTSTTSSMLEYHGYPQEDVYHAMGGDWNLVQPTPLQCQQTSFSAQWDDLAFIHSNIDHVPFYVEGLDLVRLQLGDGEIPGNSL